MDIQNNNLIDEEQIIEPDFVNEQELTNLVVEDEVPKKVTRQVLNEEDITLQGDFPLNESGLLLRQYLTWEGFADHHIEIYDNWIFKSAYNNVYGRMLTFPDGRVVCFEKLKIFNPRYTRDGKVLMLTPKLSREQGITYGADWHVDVVLRKDSCTGEELDRRTSVCIGNVPVMLKSRNCILHNKTPREMAILGEDPKDPGGYFIVSGTEKVVLLQEQLSVNKIYLMNLNSKSSTVARMTANTARGTALIELALDKKTRSVIKMRFPSISGTKQGEKFKSINVLSIFRIFGISSPEQIQNIIALFMKPERVKKSMFKLTSNLVRFMVFNDDIELMAAKMDNNRTTREEKVQDVLRVLETDLFPHLNNLPGLDNETIAEREARIARSKIYLLAVMVARFLEHLAGYRPLDDRDSWSNKRVEGAGRMMEQLFRNAWRKILGIIKGFIKLGTIKDLGGVVSKLRSSIITDTFHDSFTQVDWGVKGTQLKSNIAQTLVRDTIVATFAHINTINVGISRTDREQSKRLIQDTQWGFVCPVSTPEGETAGLVKNTSLTVKISLDRTDTDIIRLLLGDPDKGLPSYVSGDVNMREELPDKIIVNGKFLGWCNGSEVQRLLLELRRSGELPLDMGIIKEDDWLYVDISPSRLVRPLLIVSEEDQVLMIDKLGLRGSPNHILLTSGAMEYISAWEQEYIKIATSVEVINKRKALLEESTAVYRDAVDKYERLVNSEDPDPEEIEEAESMIKSAEDNINNLKNNKPYTHCELDPIAILGVSASLIPWPNHNQAPRNTYQVSMAKQALVTYHSNHRNRFDGKMKMLAFPTRAMLETEMYNVLGLDVRAPGENVRLAFLAFPYTEEDSFIFKKEFLDNGGFRIYKYLTYKTIVKHSGDVTEELTKPVPLPTESPERYKYIQMYEKGNPNNGLPKIGAPLRQGDCVIGKMQHIPASKDIRNESVFLRVGDEGVVDKVLVTSDNKTTVVIVKLRVMRIPQEGDKFAPRNAQKGTIGLVVPDIDLPADEKGITPDIIANPHSMPSRMTMEYPMELHASKHGAMRGVHINGTAFKEYEMNKYRETLRFYGMEEFGYETMRSGSTGKLISTDVNCGPVFFQALKHHVKDKVQVRSTGQVKPMTRQPPKGRGNRGGLRFGEMEHGAVISHGASAFLRERLMLVSDAYQTVFCIKCGVFAVNDAATRRYKPCRLCGDDKNFGRCVIPYANKLLIHLLAPFGINLRLEFLTSEEYAKKIFTQNTLTTNQDVNVIKGLLDEADEALSEEQEEFDDDAEDYDQGYDD